MNLAATLLPKLSDWRPTEEGRPTQTILLPEAGWSVTLAAERVESLGCRLTSIAANRAVAIPEDAELLEARARAVAGRVTGLLEPLRIVEIDRGAQVALLRSESPPTKNGLVNYYEVRLHGLNRVIVERYEAAKQPPAKRLAVPFTLTHEVIAKLVDDLLRD